MNPKIFIPKGIADQAYAECDDEISVLKITQRMERDNRALITAIRNIGVSDIVGGVALGATCAIIYRMFEIKENLPIVSAQTFKKMFWEKARVGTDEYMARQRRALIENNPHVAHVVEVCSRGVVLIRANLEEKVYAGSVCFYSFIVTQIESSG